MSKRQTSTDRAGEIRLSPAARPDDRSTPGAPAACGIASVATTRRAHAGWCPLAIVLSVLAGCASPPPESGKGTVIERRPEHPQHLIDHHRWNSHRYAPLPHHRSP